MLDPQPNAGRRPQRRGRRKGAEIVEFTLAFLPLLMMALVLIDIAWSIYVKSTLEYAVRAGVRYGITITGTQATAAGSDLTTMVKAKVQSNAMGLLNGSSGLSKIVVHYLQPPAPGSAAAATDVSTDSYGNTPGNIMVVSITNFGLAALVPRIFNWKGSPDKSATIIGATAADLIEPSQDVPPIGTAP